MSQYLSSIWGAKETDPDIEDQAVESLQETFNRGIREGKRSLLKQIDNAMLHGPLSNVVAEDAMMILGISDEEYNALALGDVHFFTNLERLPEIWRNIRRYERGRE